MANCNTLPKDEHHTGDTLTKNFKGSKHLSDECYFPTPREEKLQKTTLPIVTTNKRVKVYGNWNETRLLDLLKERLLRTAKTKPAAAYEKMPHAYAKPTVGTIPFHPVIHRGIYSEQILKELYHRGMRDHDVIRAMKFGLCSLSPEEFDRFRCFGITPEALEFIEARSYPDSQLTMNLTAIGFNDIDSWRIVAHGIISQTESCLIRLQLAGVDIPGILNWKNPNVPVCERAVKFLRKLGIEDDILQLTVQRGIDDEAREMMMDLGYVETEEEEHRGMEEVVICECSLTVLKAEMQPSITTEDDPKEKTDMSCTNADCTSMSANSVCVCNEDFRQETKNFSMRMVKNKEWAENKNYLRQIVMIPLSWAMGRALRYKPSDPKHYIAYQLLRWRHGNVSRAEMDEARAFVINATIKKDEELLERKREEEEEELMKWFNREDSASIPCESCSERQQLQRIKKRCWGCRRQWIKKYEPCEFIEYCSSCKLDLSVAREPQSLSLSPKESDSCTSEMQSLSEGVDKIEENDKWPAVRYPWQDEGEEYKEESNT